MSGCDLRMNVVYNAKAKMKFIKERQLLNTKSDSKKAGAQWIMEEGERWRRRRAGLCLE